MPSGNVSRSGHSHGPYKHFITDEKAIIGKKAAKFGVAATMKSFFLHFSMHQVCTWRDKNLKG